MPQEPVLQPLSRRTVLKGAGVALCLPLLEAMQPRVSFAQGVATVARPPVRLAALYMPNGVNPHVWKPDGVGGDFTLSPILAPLQSVKQDILVLTELMNKGSLEGDGHYVKVAPFLTGTSITRTTGSNLRCGGVSLDQMVAQHIGNLTPLPSLELSVEPVTTGVDTNVGFTRLYGSHISWSSPTTPVSREINPQLAFDRLFRTQGAGAVRADGDLSILDAVGEQARQLRRVVGADDRLKMDEYFDAVRAVEKRITFDRDRRKGEAHDDPQMRREVEKLGTRIQNYYSIPEGKRGIDHTEQVRLMLDIIVLAFWTDSTRVATFMFANEVSGKNFSFLPGVGGSHHEISHHENKAEKLAQYQRINIWHAEQYAYLLQRMKGIREGNGTLLDNSMVLWGSGMKDGNAHDPHNLPLVLAGRGGGTIATGRHLVYNKETPLCNLYRAMLRRMDTPTTHFGDSTVELPGLDDPRFKGALVGA